MRLIVPIAKYLGGGGAVCCCQCLMTHACLHVNFTGHSNSIRRSRGITSPHATPQPLNNFEQAPNALPHLASCFAAKQSSVDEMFEVYVGDVLAKPEFRMDRMIGAVKSDVICGGNFC